MTKEPKLEAADESATITVRGAISTEVTWAGCACHRVGEYRGYTIVDGRYRPATRTDPPEYPETRLDTVWSYRDGVDPFTGEPDRVVDEIIPCEALRRLFDAVVEHGDEFESHLEGTGLRRCGNCGAVLADDGNSICVVCHHDDDGELFGPDPSLDRFASIDDMVDDIENMDPPDWP